MVMVTKAVPQNGHPVHVHPRHPNQTALQTHSVRYLPLPRAALPAIRRRSRRRHHLRPDPEHRPALCLGGILRHMRGRGSVHDRRRILPHRDAHRTYPPSTTGLAMAADLRPPVDIHLDHRFLEFSLAPSFPARVRRLWLTARSCTARATWLARGAV